MLGWYNNIYKGEEQVMTEGVYTPSEEIREYHYHKKRVRASQWLGFAILVILIVVMVIILIKNKDAYAVQETMASIREQIGSLQQEYTYLATDQYELQLQRELNKLHVKAGDILTIQVKLAMDMLFFVYCYVRNSVSIAESKRYLEGSKTEELRA